VVMHDPPSTRSAGNGRFDPELLAFPDLGNQGTLYGPRISKR